MHYLLLAKPLDLRSGEKPYGAVPAALMGMERADARVEPLTARVIGSAIEVHRTLGPGLLESVYRDCMLIELRANGMRVERERRVSLKYRDQLIHSSLTMDLVVDECVVVELKAVEQIHAVHLAQVVTYLKLTGYPAGLLLNFNVTSLRAGLRRLVHPRLYVNKL